MEEKRFDLNAEKTGMYAGEVYEQRATIRDSDGQGEREKFMDKVLKGMRFVTLLQLVHEQNNYRSGLALTNPEE